MSWQDYIDNQLLASRCVTKAAIVGHDGNVWAKSEGFEVIFYNYRQNSQISNWTEPLIGINNNLVT